LQRNDHHPESATSDDPQHSLEPQFDLQASSGYSKAPFTRKNTNAAGFLNMMNRNNGEKNK